MSQDADPAVDDGTVDMKVGDLDTTPNFPGPWCKAEGKCEGYEDCYYCTRIPGHTANHAAGSGAHIVAVWNDGDSYADDAIDTVKARQMVRDGLAFMHMQGHI